MIIKTMYFGRLRELAEVREAVIDIGDGSGLDDLIEKFGQLYGAEFLAAVKEIKGLRILINGREYTLLGGMNAVLHEEDTVVLLPPITGG